MYEKLYDVLLKLKICYLRPYQELTICTFLENEENNRISNFLVSLPTGSGKSLCFMIPSILSKTKMIIIYPLISLMNDQKTRFDSYSISSVIIKGGQTKEERNKALSSFISGEVKVLITNIEMLNYLSKTHYYSLLSTLLLTLVIDEAHTLITWGNTFRPSYKELKNRISELKPRNILAFTATMDEEIERKIIKEIFPFSDPYLIKASPDRPNISYKKIKCLNKKQEILKILKEKESRPALIFSPSREKTKEYSAFLSKYFDSNYYHAGLNKEEKEKKEKWFKETKNGILVSTSAYGMGVDKQNIRTVIHISLPSEINDFLQESGRAGRDGKESSSYILYYEDEKTKLREIVENGKECIRFSLLKKMGEQMEEEKCLSCDHCLKIRRERIGEKEILSFLRFHPFIKEDEAIKKLKRIYLIRKWKLQKWSKEEIQKALSLLKKEGNICSFNERLLIKKQKEENSSNLN